MVVLKVILAEGKWVKNLGYLLKCSTTFVLSIFRKMPTHQQHMREPFARFECHHLKKNYLLTVWVENEIRVHSIIKAMILNLIFELMRNPLKMFDQESKLSRSALWKDYIWQQGLGCDGTGFAWLSNPFWRTGGCPNRLRQHHPIKLLTVTGVFCIFSALVVATRYVLLLSIWKIASAA